MQNRFNIFVDDHSVPLDIFLHLPNYRTREICKIIPTNLVLAASDLCPRTLFISVPNVTLDTVYIITIKHLPIEKRASILTSIIYLLESTCFSVMKGDLVLEFNRNSLASRSI